MFVQDVEHRLVLFWTVEPYVQNAKAEFVKSVEKWLLLRGFVFCVQRSGDVLNSDNNRQQGIRGLPLYIVKHLKFLRNDAYSRLRYINRRKFKSFLNNTERRSTRKCVGDIGPV